MKRTALTMIELVFVIVILGILAAVAMPRLSVTRDDAKISRSAYIITTSVSEIVAYAIAKGVVEENLSLMSNNIAALVNIGQAVETNPKEVTIKMGEINDCIIMDINSTLQDETLNITFNDSGGDSLCQGVQNLIDEEDYPIRLRGESVVK
jgi:general secretion pathway protein G